MSNFTHKTSVYDNGKWEEIISDTRKTHRWSFADQKGQPAVLECFQDKESLSLQFTVDGTMTRETYNGEGALVKFEGGSVKAPQSIDYADKPQKPLSIARSSILNIANRYMPSDIRKRFLTNQRH